MCMRVLLLAQLTEQRLEKMDTTQEVQSLTAGGSPRGAISPRPPSSTARRPSAQRVTAFTPKALVPMTKAAAGRSVTMHLLTKRSQSTSVGRKCYAAATSAATAAATAAVAATSAATSAATPAATAAVTITVAAAAAREPAHPMPMQHVCWVDHIPCAVCWACQLTNLSQPCSNDTHVKAALAMALRLPLLLHKLVPKGATDDMHVTHRLCQRNGLHIPCPTEGRTLTRCIGIMYQHMPCGCTTSFIDQKAA